uniref:Uncharacterized protein n=1 Tax=Setaria italica TaxID=4555 RepID=K3XZY4_SETIT
MLLLYKRTRRWSSKCVELNNTVGVNWQGQRRPVQRPWSVQAGRGRLVGDGRPFWFLFLSESRIETASRKDLAVCLLARCLCSVSLRFSGEGKTEKVCPWSLAWERAWGAEIPKPCLQKKMEVGSSKEICSA